MIRNYNGLSDLVKHLNPRDRLVAGQVFARAYDAHKEQLDLFPDVTVQGYLARQAGYKAVREYLRKEVL